MHSIFARRIAMARNTSFPARGVTSTSAPPSR